MSCRDEVEWLRELPYSISLPHYNAVVVHAGRLPNTLLTEQSAWDYVTMRNLVSDEVTGTLKATDGHKKGKPWASVWDSKSSIHVYFGHDAKRGLQKYPKATGLDTGACYGMLLLPFTDNHSFLCIYTLL